MTTVMTCGVFDLLHVGHIRLLCWAAQQGGKLLVLVDHDVLVNKGPDRPVRCAVDRAELVGMLKPVWATIVCVSEDARAQLIRKWRPTVFVKGADWRGKPLPFQAVLDEVGCQVQYAPYFPGHSTSSLIAKVRAA